MSKKSELLASQTKSLKIEFTVDDELTGLVLENTHGATKRAVTNIVRCLTLVAGGTSMYTSCKLTGVTRSRLQSWRTKEWYGRAISLIQQRLDEQLDGQMTHVINKGLSKVHHRLDKGDAIVDTKTGNILGYKPVSGRDAAIITSIFFDKRNLLRNKPTTIHSSQSTDERLVMLSERFKEIAQNSDYIEDAEYTEYVTGSEAPVLSDEHSEERHVKGLETQTVSSNIQTGGLELGEDIRTEVAKDTGKEESESKWSFTGPQVKESV